ncbi:MAG: hypothetical protein GY942_26985 [Aestuariibacter sp.]|nr:hypothetical protein [Aestuariibacter sp.]
MAIYTSSANLYTLGKLKRGQKVYSFDTDTFKVLLTTSSHTPDQAADEFVDDITNEVSGNGYARQTVTPTWAVDGLVARLTLTDPTWTASGGSIAFRRWHLFADLGTDATSPLLAYGYADATPADATIADTITGTLDFSDVSGLFTS